MDLSRFRIWQKDDVTIKVKEHIEKEIEDINSNILNSISDLSEKQLHNLVGQREALLRILEIDNETLSEEDIDEKDED